MKENDILWREVRCRPQKISPGESRDSEGTQRFLQWRESQVFLDAPVVGPTPPFPVDPDCTARDSRHCARVNGRRSCGLDVRHKREQHKSRYYRRRHPAMGLWQCAAYQWWSMSDASTHLVRVARPADSDAVGALLLASYSILLAASYDGGALGQALSLMTRANPTLLASGTYYLVEREPGIPVGCGGWSAARPGSGEIIEGEAHIRHVAIHPEWVGRGIGTSLLARCFSEARQSGIRKLHCFSTLNAERFYRGCGFETVEPFDVPLGPGVTLPGVFMSRELP
jgi:N-acetylglutamate synthase-like GNAT family acetyltransferase